MANIYKRVAFTQDAFAGFGNKSEVQIWVCPSVSTASGTFTVTGNYSQSQARNIGIAVFELSAYGGLDGMPGVSVISGTNTTITVSNPQADVGSADFAVAVAAIAAASAMSTPATGGAAWTSAYSNTAGAEISYRQNASAVTDSATWSWTTAVAGCAAIASFVGTLVGGQVAVHAVSDHTVSASLPSLPSVGHAIVVVLFLRAGTNVGFFFSSVTDNQGTPTGPYLVQSSPAVNFGAQGAPSITLPGVTQGNALIAPVVYLDTGHQSFLPSNVGDGQQAATYSKDVSVSSAGNSSASIWSLFGANAGSHGVAFTKANGATGGNVYWVAQVQEWAGLPQTNSLDLTATATGTSTGPVTATTGTLSNANDAVIAVGGGDTGTIATPTTGWGTPSGWNDDGVVAYLPSGAIADIVPGATSALSPNFGTLSVSNHWAIAIAAYQPAAAAAVVGPNRIVWGPGISPNKQTMFALRPLSNQIATTVFVGAAGGMKLGGGGNLLPASALGASGGLKFGGRVIPSSVLNTADRYRRGPGPSPDWEVMFTRRNLDSTLSGALIARGGVNFGGFATSSGSATSPVGASGGIKFGGSAGSGTTGNMQAAGGVKLGGGALLQNFAQAIGGMKFGGFMSSGIGPFAAVQLAVYEILPTLGSITLIWGVAGPDGPFSQSTDSSGNAAPGYRVYINGVPQPAALIAQTITYTGLVLGTSYAYAVVPVNALNQDSGSLSNVILYEHGVSEIVTVVPRPWIDPGEAL